MKQVFDFQEPYCNLRSETSQSRMENMETTHHGIQSVKFIGPKIWAMIPQNIKTCKSLHEFKKLIEVWKPKAYPCRMCKKYVANIGFIKFDWTYTFHKIYCVLLVLLFSFSWLALISYTYYLVWSIAFLR